VTVCEHLLPLLHLSITRHSALDEFPLNFTMQMLVTIHAVQCEARICYLVYFDTYCFQMEGVHFNDNVQHSIFCTFFHILCWFQDVQYEALN